MPFDADYYELITCNIYFHYFSLISGHFIISSFSFLLFFHFRVKRYAFSRCYHFSHWCTFFWLCENIDFLMLDFLSFWCGGWLIFFGQLWLFSSIFSLLDGAAVAFIIMPKYDGRFADYFFPADIFICWLKYFALWLISAGGWGRFW